MTPYMLFFITSYVRFSSKSSNSHLLQKVSPPYNHLSWQGWERLNHHPYILSKLQSSILTSPLMSSISCQRIASLIVKWCMYPSVRWVHLFKRFPPTLPFSVSHVGIPIVPGLPVQHLLHLVSLLLGRILASLLLPYLSSDQFNSTYLAPSR